MPKGNTQFRCKFSATCVKAGDKEGGRGRDKERARERERERERESENLALSDVKYSCMTRRWSTVISNNI